jgi:hypothetical protein
MYKLVIGITAAVLAVAACGSSSKSSSSGSGSTTTVSGGAANASDFASLVAKAKTSAFKVTYQTSDGKTGIVAQDGTGKQAVTDGNQLLIDNGSTVISCDGTTSTATCRDLGTAGRETFGAGMSLITGTANAIAALGSSSLFNGQTSSETIAGRDATCVTVSAANMSGVFGSIASHLGSETAAKVCADNETGVLLKLSGTTNESTTDVFVATDFSQPSASDFEPPSTPKSVPSIPQLTLPSG